MVTIAKMLILGDMTMPMSFNVNSSLFQDPPMLEVIIIKHFGGMNVN